MSIPTSFQNIIQVARRLLVTTIRRTPISAAVSVIESVPENVQEKSEKCFKKSFKSASECDHIKNHARIAHENQLRSLYFTANGKRGMNVNHVNHVPRKVRGMRNESESSSHCFLFHPMMSYCRNIRKMCFEKSYR